MHHRVSYNNTGNYCLSYDVVMFLLLATSLHHYLHPSLFCFLIVCCPVACRGNISGKLYDSEPQWEQFTTQTMLDENSPVTANDHDINVGTYCN